MYLPNVCIYIVTIVYVIAPAFHKSWPPDAHLLSFQLLHFYCVFYPQMHHRHIVECPFLSQGHKDVQIFELCFPAGESLASSEIIYSRSIKSVLRYATLLWGWFWLLSLLSWLFWHWTAHGLWRISVGGVLQLLLLLLLPLVIGIDKETEGRLSNALARFPSWLKSRSAFFNKLSLLLPKSVWMSMLPDFLSRIRLQHANHLPH